LNCVDVQAALRYLLRLRRPSLKTWRIFRSPGRGVLGLDYLLEIPTRTFNHLRPRRCHQVRKFLRRWQLRAPSLHHLRLPTLPMPNPQTLPISQRRSTRLAVGAPANPPMRLRLPAMLPGSIHPYRPLLFQEIVSQIFVSPPRPTIGPGQLPVTDLTDPQGCPKPDVSTSRTWQHPST
jgi:hypothetical protein